MPVSQPVNNPYIAVAVLVVLFALFATVAVRVKHKATPQENLTIELTYEGGDCSGPTPLEVKIHNGEHRRWLNEISFKIVGVEKTTNELMAGESWDPAYTRKRNLGPNETWRECIVTPMWIKPERAASIQISDLNSAFDR